MKRVSILRTWLTSLGMLLYIGYIQAQDRGSIEIEVDPTTFLLKGYSLHAAYQVGASRFNLGSYAMEIPKLLNGNKDFTQKNTAIQLKYDHMFQGIRGWFAGAQVDFTRKKITHDNTDVSITRHSTVAGVRTGYRFMFGKEENNYKGFYMSPWVGLLINVNPVEARIENSSFEERTLIPFPTLHLGWRF